VVKSRREFNGLTLASMTVVCEDSDSSLSVESMARLKLHDSPMRKNVYERSRL
jgi:hypothetical protein